MRLRGGSAARRASFLVWRDTGHPEGGGSELFVERVAEGMARAGWAVTVATAAYPGARRDEVRNGVAYRRRGGRLTVYLHGLAYLLGAGRHSDVVVDVQNGVPFFSALVRRRGVVVLVHHVHREQWQIIYPGLVGHVGWWLESRFAPWLYRRRPYLTVSDATRRDLIRLGVEPERIEIVHNGLDMPHPHHRRPRAEVPTICVLGRLVPHKQVEHALLVAARLRVTIPDLRVEVVGDGWWRGHLEERASELAIEDLVTFHGTVSDTVRDTVLDRSWVLLAPSIKEGWGIAIMEAAAHGVPTVAYRSAGGVCESILDGQTGHLVDDVDELTTRTEELLADGALRTRLGTAAAQRAAEFDWSSSASRFASLLDHAVDSGRVATAARSRPPERSPDSGRAQTSLTR